MSNNLKKPFVIALAGPTSSGKTTLGVSLAERYDALLLSSDAIRAEIGRHRHVWSVMQIAAVTAMKSGRNVVLDATGMAPRYQSLLAFMRRHYPVFTVRLTVNLETWNAREIARTDRDAFGFDVYERSLGGSHLKGIDLAFNTTHLTPQEVLNTVVQGVEVAFETTPHSDAA